MIRTYELDGRKYVDADDYTELEDSVASLRAELATVTAELSDERHGSAESEREYQNERAAHAEAKAALASSRAKYDCYKHSVTQTVGGLRLQLEASRAETAAAAARIAELETERNQAREGWRSTGAMAVESETALRELRERVRDGVNHRNWNEVLEAISERQ